MNLLPDNTNQNADDFDFGTIVAIFFGIVVAIIALPLLIVWALIMNTSNTSRGSGSCSPRNDEKTQAEVDPDGWKDMVMIHQHYEMNDFGTIQGLKDPEW